MSPWSNQLWVEVVCGASWEWDSGFHHRPPPPSHSRDIRAGGVRCSWGPCNLISGRCYWAERSPRCCHDGSRGWAGEKLPSVAGSSDNGRHHSPKWILVTCWTVDKRHLVACRPECTRTHHRETRELVIHYVGHLDPWSYQFSPSSFEEWIIISITEAMQAQRA